MIHARFLALSIAVLLIPNTAHSAATTILASKDNSIFQSAPGNSAGGAAGILAGTNGAGSPRRGLIQFDVAASVPARATITSAQLTMYLGNANNSMSQVIELHQLFADWGEGTAGSSTPGIGGAGNGFTAGVGDATWNEREVGAAAWSNPGGTGDFSPAASATTTVGGPLEGPHTWLTTPGLVSDVQSWLDSPATNFGWAIINANESTSQTIKVFYSRSATLNSTGGALDPGRRPALAITYVIPEPSALLLLSVGLLIAACRRTRRRGLFCG